MQDIDSHSLHGAIDGGTLHDFRSEFERLELLANESLDAPVNPDELRLQFDDGIGEAASASLTVRWSVQGDYNVHCSDDRGRDLR